MYPFRCFWEQLLAQLGITCLLLWPSYSKNDSPLLVPSYSWKQAMEKEEVVTYTVKDRVAYITLNRPDRLNAINDELPRALQAAVTKANWGTTNKIINKIRANHQPNLCCVQDDSVHVILLTGAGRAFCSGYDLIEYAQMKGHNVGQQVCWANNILKFIKNFATYVQEMPWDPLIDYQFMSHNTNCFMSLWRSLKPVVCKIKGFAVAGGSDIALCCVRFVLFSLPLLV